MATQSDHVRSWRLAAALSSAGLSNRMIYDEIMRTVRLHGVFGDALDFGAGTGHISKTLLQTNKHRSICAVDVISRPDELPKEIVWLSVDLNDAVPRPDGSYDLIVAVEIIEHLENPRFVVREWTRLLRPGGVIVMSTPNNESIRSLVSLLVRGHFCAFTDTSYPAHITALLKKDLIRIFSENGLIIKSISYTRSGGIPGMPYISWQDLSFKLLRGMRFSDNMILSACKPWQAARDRFVDCIDGKWSTHDLGSAPGTRPEANRAHKR
jgi:2-polyprenyl-3-methyl-5-hydroxy-6-metoxy-1,4-benzoquinol methylase